MSRLKTKHYPGCCLPPLENQKKRRTKASSMTLIPTLMKKVFFLVDNVLIKAALLSSKVAEGKNCKIQLERIAWRY